MSRIKPEENFYHENSICDIKLPTDEQENIKIKSDFFNFDHTFHSICNNQNLVYNKVCANLVNDILQDGKDKAIVTLGQVGSGKSYSLTGKYGDETQMGIIPRLMSELINAKSIHNFEIQVSHYEIYNERINDLLKENNKSLSILENPDGSFFIKKLVNINIENENQFSDLMKKGRKRLHMMTINDAYQSNLSHSILCVKIKRQGYLIEPQIFLVDLAGHTLKETSYKSEKNIQARKSVNTSLSLLTSVLDSIARNKMHVPYRNSKLTRIFSSILNQRCDISFLVCIPISIESWHETTTTLNICKLLFKMKRNIKKKQKIENDEECGLSVKTVSSMSLNSDDMDTYSDMSDFSNESNTEMSNEALSIILEELSEEILEPIVNDGHLEKKDKKKVISDIARIYNLNIVLHKIWNTKSCWLRNFNKSLWLSNEGIEHLLPQASTIIIDKSIKLVSRLFKYLRR